MNDRDKLRRVEARLESVLDIAVSGVIVIDDVGTMLVYNQACETLFGYSAEEALGRNVKMLMPPKLANAHDGYLRHYIDTGERKIIGIGRAVEGRHKDGTVIPIDLAVADAAMPGGGRQFIGILRDLRPQRAAEQQLKDMQDQLIHLARVSALDEMGAALAHELNQPLTALGLYLQAGKRMLDKADENGVDTVLMREVIGKAFSEAERAGNIVQRMRHFVEKRDTHRRPVSLTRIADEATAFAAIGRLADGVDWYKQAAADLPAVFADPVQIQQIIVNLVRNALEAIQEAPRREISTQITRQANRLVYAITDSGPGIDPAILPDLFRAFATSKKSGMGLGLAISRSIAQAHGGDLTVKPGGDGQGACFYLTLPIDGANDNNA